MKEKQENTDITFLVSLLLKLVYVLILSIVDWQWAIYREDRGQIRYPITKISRLQSHVRRSFSWKSKRNN